ncbi:class I SAM-dependent methyltransferase [Amycolatopsis sp. CA-230715]|uniref:class I SAM-dependent methyltransferase n=1 Tax=Amycolatopsis sp. CA-230715 TaxID=2745196 RepID=UPI001C00E3ED|nr:class I SAM-dependent methyltransferase [Amycolatopsis sp. CA-230715]QWF82521.1 Cypemycin N-terminal methyltransferase [Amycolatopsis sp. CA-230715]
MNPAGKSYGESMAAIYDLIYPDSGEAKLAAEFVAGLCPEDGTVVELGIGTGRVATHIAGTGRKVYGIDSSPEMLAKLRERDPEGRITALEGDFSATTVIEDADVVLMAINTLGALLTQEAQVETVLRIGEQLRDGGAAVLETIGPGEMYRRTYPVTSAQALSADSMVIATAQADKASQTAVATYCVLGSGGLRIGQEAGRHIWPSELDLMAKLAGLRLEGRWSGWRREQPTGDHDRVISVYRKPGSAS